MLAKMVEKAGSLGFTVVLGDEKVVWSLWNCFSFLVELLAT